MRIRKPATRAVKRPVGILEPKTDFVSGARAVAEGFREVPPVNVVPIGEVAFAGVVADHDHGFIPDGAVDVGARSWLIANARTTSSRIANRAGKRRRQFIAGSWFEMKRETLYNYTGMAAGPLGGRSSFGSVSDWTCSKVASGAISRRSRPCGVTSMKASSVTM